jgi:hypothetical protein
MIRRYLFFILLILISIHSVHAQKITVEKAIFNCQSQLYQNIGIDLEYSLTQYENYLIESRILKSTDVSGYRSLLLKMQRKDFNNHPKIRFSEVLLSLVDEKELPTESELNQCSNQVLSDTLSYDHSNIKKIKQLSDSITTRLTGDFSIISEKIIQELPEEYLISQINKEYIFHKLSEASLLNTFDLINNESENPILIKETEKVIFILSDSEYYMDGDIRNLKELTKTLRVLYVEDKGVSTIRIKISPMVSEVRSVIMVNKLNEQRNAILDEYSLKIYSKRFEILEEDQKRMISIKIPMLIFIDN